MDTPASPKASPRRRPTMRDVAEAAGVSLKTVSRVVNGEPGVTSGTLARVLATVESLGFRRNDIARDLRGGRTTSSIGLVIEDVANPFFSAVNRAVEDVARGHDVVVIAGSSEESPDRERELVETLCGRRVDGLVIVPAGTDHRYLLPEVAMGTVPVFLDRPPAGIEADTVLLDNAGGAHQAVEHLVAAGHRRVAVLGDREDIYTMRERLDGFRRAMAAAGARVDEGLVRLGLRRPEDAAAATADLLALPVPPTALFPLNNRMTIGAVRAAWRHGAQVAIVGFDDFELADLVPVPLTVVAHDAVEMGRLGAELLFSRLAGTVTGPPRRVVVPTRLVDRGLAGGPSPAQ